MSSPSVQVSPDSLDSSLLSFTTPEKYKGQYCSFCTWDNSGHSLFLQLPLGQIKNVNNGTVVIEYPTQNRPDDGEALGDAGVDTAEGTKLIKAIRSVESFVVNYIHERSEQFFNGKRFSLEKIQGALESSVIDENKLVIDIENSPRLKDQYGTDRTLADLDNGTDIIALVSLRNIVFTKTSFKLRWILQQARVYIEDTLSEWCIADISPSTKAPSEPSVEQAETDLACNDNPEDTPEVPQNDDDQDLF